MSKQLHKHFNLKAFGKGKQVSNDQLAKINTYALEPLSTDQVYVRRFLVAHNGIDRDRERFDEQLLEQFAATLPGKGMFFDGHPGGWNGSGAPGTGRWFDAGTETMNPQEFKQLTGEEIALPEGITQVKVLWGEAYMLKDLAHMEDCTRLIDAGIVTFVSIGFNAPFKMVSDDNGNCLYGEYYPNGEALEASLVWLGAQPGASAKSAKGSQPDHPNEEDHSMKEFLQNLGKQLGLKKALTEENALEGIVAVVEEKDATISQKDQEIEGLKASAADGKAYRKTLVDDAIRFGVLIDEVPTDEDGQKSEQDFLASLPIERLKLTRDKFEKRARAKCPTNPVFTGKDESDRQQSNKDAGQQGKKTKSGRKDYSDPANNELFATIGK
jgi:hypothetical protein